jgi:glycosyltransferase involved in cell wall biosynthesis
MRVIHVAPSAFGPQGLYGGGGRYPLELARALAAEVECELVTFGPRPGRWLASGGLWVRVLPAALSTADIIHAHHYQSVPTRMPAVTARVRGAGTAVTDPAGSASRRR